MTENYNSFAYGVYLNLPHMWLNISYDFVGLAKMAFKCLQQKLLEASVNASFLGDLHLYLHM